VVEVVLSAVVVQVEAGDCSREQREVVTLNLFQGL
jgi:hypothetical protein